MNRLIASSCALWTLLLLVPHLGAGEPVALTVTTIAPQEERWPALVHADGGLAPWQEAVVAGEVGGLRITAVLVDVGDRVVRGQELATLDRASVQASVDQAAAAVAEAEASLEQAVADAERSAALRGSGALSEQAIAQYAVSKRTAEARLASARAALAQWRISLDRSRIIAPDDGIICARSALLGGVTQVGGELFRLVRQGRIEWQAEVTAQDLGRVRPGQTARLRLPDGTAIAGTVRVVGPVLDGKRRTALVYVALTADRAQAGMFAGGDILVGEPQAVWTLPEETVLTRDGHALILRVDADGRVHEERVVPGRRMQGRVEIVGGLPTGTRVVATGATFLNDGDRVRVK